MDVVPTAAVMPRPANSRGAPSAIQATKIAVRKAASLRTVGQCVERALEFVIPRRHVLDRQRLALKTRLHLMVSIVWFF
jgi:hypothetical protein